MPPFQVFFLLSTVAIFALAWLKGGHVERRGVVFLLVAFIASVLVQDIMIERYAIGVMLVDLIFLLTLGWLAFTKNRWWPIPATAGHLLAMLAHVAFVLDPDMSLRVNVAARWVFGVLVLYCLLAGVVERWLAGEQPVSTGLAPSRVG